MELLGEVPSQTPFYDDVLDWLGSLAAFTADRPDVWIEVWNEPFHWQGTNQTDDLWLEEMTALVEVVRAAGNSNLVVVPAGSMGQGDGVLRAHGSDLRAIDDRVVFDLHLYERWMLDRTTEEAGEDLDELAAAGLPLLIGELAPQNAGELMDPRPMLDLLAERDLTCTAWFWKYDETNPDALLTSSGAPNDVDNNEWGSSVRAFLGADR